MATETKNGAPYHVSLYMQNGQSMSNEKPQHRKKFVEHSSVKSKKKRDSSIAPIHTSIPVFILCPFDNCDAEGPFNTLDSVVKHFSRKHNIVLLQPKNVKPFLEKYLEFWKAEIEKGNTVTNKQGQIVLGNTTTSFDAEVRSKMREQKLVEILNVQDQERKTCAMQPKPCLFCDVISTSRAGLFRHMFQEHSFNIGLPDNLVNVDNFLSILRSQLDKLECLFCEKTFKSSQVLRKHMRKKKHFKINPKNHLYDQFYVVNYVEPGKDWEEIEQEEANNTDEKDCKDSEDDSWDDWEEPENEPTQCLLCENVSKSGSETLEHMKIEHNFDFHKLCLERDLDFYSAVRFINYARHCYSLCRCFACSDEVTVDFDCSEKLIEHFSEKKCFLSLPPETHPLWKDPQYLFPVYEEDGLLHCVITKEDFGPDGIVNQDIFEKEE